MQNAKFIEIFESKNPDDHINDNVTIKIIDWFKMKKRKIVFAM